MAYNHKQYDAARNFVNQGDDNVTDAQDRLRIQTYNLYEDIYINSSFKLQLVLRGEDQTPILLPTGSKLVEATNRFLGVNVDYLVEAFGDQGLQQALNDWFREQLFKREKFKTKFESNKRWGLVRGDAVFYIYADPNKDPFERISICELDPRQVFEIEDAVGNILGYHLVERVRDWRDEQKDSCKEVVKRRTFIKDIDDNGILDKTSPVYSQLTYWELSKWDDRYVDNANDDDDLKQVHGGPGEDPEFYMLGSIECPITQLPIYKWNNSPMQNTTWGTSQLAGLETLMYAINQSMTDEDCTVVFQGLGMFVTTSAPPIDPNTGSVTDWNIGPMQIIEIGAEQKFDRVSGITDLSPFQDHMSYMDEKGLAEGRGIPEVAIGRVDVQSAESGISLKLQFMPLLAQNSEKELGLINLLDQLFHDIVETWLPAYEPEAFGNVEAMQQMSVVCVFDDPMPVDRNATIEETVLLRTNNLILVSMAVAKLRNLGWDYPTEDPDTGEPLDDNAIAQLLSDQAAEDANAADPFAQAAGADMAAFAGATGIPTPPTNVPTTPPKKQTIALNGS